MHPSGTGLEGEENDPGVLPGSCFGNYAFSQPTCVNYMPAASYLDDPRQSPACLPAFLICVEWETTALPDGKIQSGERLAQHLPSAATCQPAGSAGRSLRPLPVVAQLCTPSRLRPQYLPRPPEDGVALRCGLCAPPTLRRAKPRAAESARPFQRPGTALAVRPRSSDEAQGRPARAAGWSGEVGSGDRERRGGRTGRLHVVPGSLEG